MTVIDPDVLQQYPNIESKLEETALKFLEQGMAFTAYDVTVETREREKIKLRHSSVQGAIHGFTSLMDALDFGFTDANGNAVEWRRTQVPMPNGQPAFVYHPESYDPFQYQPRGSSAPAVQVADPVADPSTQPFAPKITDGRDKNGVFEVDYRNRLFIRTNFLQTIGLTKSDDVYVLIDKDKNDIYLSGDASLASEYKDGKCSVASQMVERYGDMRLSGRTLTSAGMTGNKFSIKNSEIVLDNRVIPVVKVNEIS